MINIFKILLCNQKLSSDWTVTSIISSHLLCKQFSTKVANRELVLSFQVRLSIRYEGRLYSYPLKGKDENNIWPMSVLLLIIVAIVFLAIIGLGWNTFFDGVLKGADKIGIASILENATQSATEMAKNASRNLVG